MDTNRITINSYDLSEVTDTQVTTPVCGYTVINAPKGPATPMRITAGDFETLQDVFGTASAEYPDIYEARTFLADYDLYISAPYESAKVPVACVTKEGIFRLSEFIKYDSNLEDYINGMNPDYVPLLENGNELTSSNDLYALYDVRYKYTDGEFTYSDSKIVYSTPNSTPKIEINLNGNNSNDFTKISINDCMFDISGTSITYRSSNVGNMDDGKISITGGTTEVIKNFVKKFADETLRDETIVYAGKKVTKDDIYALILPKYPSNRKLHISFENFNKNKGYSSDNVSSRNILKMSVYEEGAYRNANRAISITGSLDMSAKDANGSQIGFSDMNYNYMKNNFFVVYTYKKLDVIENQNMVGYPSVVLDRGEKKFKSVKESTVSSEVVTYENSSYNEGWVLAKDDEFSCVDVFFQSNRNKLITSSNNYPTSTFFKLGDEVANGGTHILAGYIFNYTVEADRNTTKEQVLACGQLNYGSRYWNVCNEAVILLDNGEKIMSPMTGARALMQARIIENGFGGKAPMYLNKNSMGGQLYLEGFQKIRYRYDKYIQSALDELNFNPIINDRTYGVMVVGQKTCKAGAISDWSYIGHVSAFLNCQREIRENVCIPQLGKANNDYYRNLRAIQVRNILSKRLGGNERIWAAATVDTSTNPGVNDAQARSARKFIINVKVKVDVFSEYVELNFTNVGQDVELASNE